MNKKACRKADLVPKYRHVQLNKCPKGTLYP
jgi:hypothetical protein